MRASTVERWRQRRILAQNANVRFTGNRRAHARNPDLTIRFGGHVAVNAVSCRFAPGTLTAIVGPNGGQDHLLQPDLGQLRRRGPVR